MRASHYEPLSALDAAMVFMETDSVPMHVGIVAIFDGTDSFHKGEIDEPRVRAHIAGLIDDLPRHRQRLAFVPIERHPIWVDAEHVDLHHHVRFVSLSPPGTDAEFKELVSWLISARLDPERPLWEVIVVRGLEGDRFAMVCKLHHCMVDGVAASRVFRTFFPFDAGAPDRIATPSSPRAAPSGMPLVVAEVARRARIAVSFTRSARKSLAESTAPRDTIRREARGMIEALRTKVTPAHRGPLNPPSIGSDHTFDWVRLDLHAVKSVRKRLGATINDVALAIVAGAVRRYLAKHADRCGAAPFRVLVPFDTRAIARVRGESGNRVVPTLAVLPVELPTPRARYDAISRSTRAIKASGQVRGLMRLEDLANLAVVAPIAGLVRAATRFWAGNLIVTNVPGPLAPCYFLGARLKEAYPIVPIMANQALGVALFTYADGLHFGFHADRSAVPDLGDFRSFVQDELVALAGEAE